MEGWFKLNVHATVYVDRGKVWRGVVKRNHDEIGNGCSEVLVLNVLLFVFKV